METDLIADLVLAATLIGICIIFCGLSRRQRRELRAEIRGADECLGNRIDAVRAELVEARVATAGRVARVEGHLFGVPRPDTETGSGGPANANANAAGSSGTSRRRGSRPQVDALPG